MAVLNDLRVIEQMMYKFSDMSDFKNARDCWLRWKAMRVNPYCQRIESTGCYLVTEMIFTMEQIERIGSQVMAMHTLMSNIQRAAAVCDFNEAIKLRTEWDLAYPHIIFDFTELEDQIEILGMYLIRFQSLLNNEKKAEATLVKSLRLATDGEEEQRGLEIQNRINQHRFVFDEASRSTILKKYEDFVQSTAKKNSIKIFFLKKRKQYYNFMNFNIKDLFEDFLTDLGIDVFLPVEYRPTIDDEQAIQQETVKDFKQAIDNLKLVFTIKGQRTLERPVALDQLPNSSANDKSQGRLLPIYTSTNDGEYIETVGLDWNSANNKDERTRWMVERGMDMFWNVSEEKKWFEDSKIPFPIVPICTLFIVLYMHIGFQLEVSLMIMKYLIFINRPEKGCTTLWGIYKWYRQLTTYHGENDLDNIMLLTGLTLSSVRSQIYERNCYVFTDNINVCMSPVAPNSAVCQAHDRWNLIRNPYFLMLHRFDELQQFKRYKSFSKRKRYEIIRDNIPIFEGKEHKGNWIKQFLVDIGIYMRTSPIKKKQEPLRPANDDEEWQQQFRNLNLIYNNQICDQNEYYFDITVPSEEFAYRVMQFDESIQNKPKLIETFLFNQFIKTKGISVMNKENFVAQFQYHAAKMNLSRTINRFVSNQMYILPIIIHWNRRLHKSDCHMCVVYFDKEAKEHWFFDPTVVCRRAENFSEWIKDVKLIDGWTWKIVQEKNSRNISLASAFNNHYNHEQDIDEDNCLTEDGICSSLCILFSVLVARYNAKGHNLNNLSKSLNRCVVKIIDKLEQPEALRYRLLLWQHYLSVCTNHQTLRELLGIRLSAARGAMIRPCGVFLSIDSNGNEIRCMKMNEPRSTLCREHKIGMHCEDPYSDDDSHVSDDMIDHNDSDGSDEPKNKKPAIELNQQN